MSSRGKVCIVELNLHFPYSRSLKDRRSILTSFKSKAKDKFNVLAIESEPNDNFKMGTLTLCSLSKNGDDAKRTVRNLMNYLEENYPVQITKAQEEIL